MAVIYEDTRQQKGKHGAKHRWFDAHGIELVHVALTSKGHEDNHSVAPSGDYCRDGSNVSVDTKRDIPEIMRNLTREHSRIADEIRRCDEAGYKLVFLIETNEAESIDDLRCYISEVCRKRCIHYRNRKCWPPKAHKCLKYKRKPAQGITLAAVMTTMERKHGKMFYFCTRQNAAEKICELLGVEYERDA